jgi:hypothetical protein
MISIRTEELLMRIRSILREEASKRRVKDLLRGVLLFKFTSYPTDKAET